MRRQRRELVMRQCRWLFVPAILGALFLTSCGKSDRRPVYAVQGKILYRGKPPAGAFVTFHPRDDSDPGAPRPTAQVETDGTFRLSTYLSADGAPAGRYAVTLLWPSAERQIDSENAGPDRLQGKYSDPKTTPLQAEVKEGTNDLEPFQLK